MEMNFCSLAKVEKQSPSSLWLLVLHRDNSAEHPAVQHPVFFLSRENALGAPQPRLIG